MRHDRYERSINIARQRGVDFRRDFHAQSVGDLMAGLAKEAGYRKPKFANGSTGRYFFQLLAKLAKGEKEEC